MTPVSLADEPAAAGSRGGEVRPQPAAATVVSATPIGRRVQAETPGAASLAAAEEGEGRLLAESSSSRSAPTASVAGSTNSAGSSGGERPEPTVAWQSVRRSASRLISGSEPVAPQSVSREDLIESGMTSAEVDARMVRQHREDLLQEHFARWVLCSGVMFVVVLLTGFALQVWVLVEFFKADDKDCDVPLRMWVTVLICLWSARFFGRCIDRCFCCWQQDPDTSEQPPLRVMCKNIAVAIFDFVWVICLGLHWVSVDGDDGEEPACRKVIPGLFSASQVYIYFHLASMVYIWMNIVGLRQMLRILLRRGLLHTSSAAPPAALEKNTTVVTLTDEDLDVDPPPSCPVCMEDYAKNGEAIVKTNFCGHLFHQACLKNWLQTGRTCPICRHDLGNIRQDQDKE